MECSVTSSFLWHNLPKNKPWNLRTSEEIYYANISNLLCPICHSKPLALIALNSVCSRGNANKD